MIRPLLLQIRRRLAWQAMSRYLVWYTLGGATLYTVLFGLSPLNARCYGGGIALVVLAGSVITTLLTRPSLREIARRLDSEAQTKDRLITALAFEDDGEEALPWQRNAVAECSAYLLKIDFRQHTPWKLPHAARWLALPFMALAALSFWGERLSEPQGGERKPDPALVKKAEELERMAENAEKGESELDKKIAEALRNAAENLRAEAAAADSPEKAMLRELSALEQILQGAKGGQGMEQLAKAFEKSESLNRAAEALHKGEAAKAADELGEAARLMREMAERMQALAAGQGAAGARSGEQAGEQAGEAREMSRFEKAMRAAAQSAGEKTAMGQAASEAADAASQRQGEGVEQAMQRMAEALRRSQSGQGDPRQAQAQIDASIAQLREMKAGGSGDDASPRMAQGEGSQPGNGEGQQGMGEQPGGSPGSENDQGTKPSATGDEKGDRAENSLASQVQGLLGEGESLHMLTPTQGGAEEAQRQYRALYEAAAPEAEDALNRENIPIGSRLYIKRYFESIRPNK